MAALPLNVWRKFIHHNRSSLTAFEINALCETCLSALIWLKIRRRKTLPPFTTPAAQESRPARAWSWRLDARLRVMKPWSSDWKLCSLSNGRRKVIVIESSSIPKKVIFVVGSTTFPQWMQKPSLLRSCINKFSAIAHSAFDSDIIRKSSRYTTTRSYPLRAIMRLTAWVRRWKMPGLSFAPKQSLVSRIYTVFPLKCHFKPVTFWLCSPILTDL